MFLIAASQNNIQKMHQLLNIGADIDYSDSKHWTALHYAVYNDSIDAVRFLIHRDASTFIITKDDHQLAIHFAMIFKREDIFFYLMTNSAQNKNALDSRRNTLLHYAVLYGSRKMFTYLHNIIPKDQTNIYGRTALNHAYYFDNKDAIKLLENAE